MRQDSRLSRMLHVLLHLDNCEEPMTSDTIAQLLGMNSSVVRRTMADLRKAGIVNAAKGHGGGWALAKTLDQITLLGVYEALGEPRLFALGPALDSATCALEGAANTSLEQGLSAASDAFRSHLASTTLAKLIGNAKQTMPAEAE